MCKFIEKIYTKHLNNQVEKYWKKYKFDMSPNHVSHNNEGDAFKHCFMSAELYLLLGYNLAKKIGDEHENWEGNPESEKIMDLHNNTIGYLIASGYRIDEPFWFLKKWQDAIAERIMKAMKNGSLITKPIEEE